MSEATIEKRYTTIGDGVTRERSEVGDATIDDDLVDQFTSRQWRRELAVLAQRLLTLSEENALLSAELRRSQRRELRIRKRLKGVKTFLQQISVEQRRKTVNDESTRQLLELSLERHRYEIRHEERLRAEERQRLLVPYLEEALKLARRSKDEVYTARPPPQLIAAVFPPTNDEDRGGFVREPFQPMPERIIDLIYAHAEELRLSRIRHEEALQQKKRGNEPTRMTRRQRAAIEARTAMVEGSDEQPRASIALASLRMRHGESPNLERMERERLVRGAGPYTALRRERPQENESVHVNSRATSKNKDEDYEEPGTKRPKKKVRRVIDVMSWDDQIGITARRQDSQQPPPSPTVSVKSHASTTSSTTKKKKKKKNVGETSGTGRTLMCSSCNVKVGNKRCPHRQCLDCCALNPEGTCSRHKSSLRQRARDASRAGDGGRDDDAGNDGEDAVVAETESATGDVEGGVEASAGEGAGDNDDDGDKDETMAEVVDDGADGVAVTDTTTSTTDVGTVPTAPEADAAVNLDTSVAVAQ